MKWKHLAAMVVVAVCLGLLEAAWTTPDAPGATEAGLGERSLHSDHCVVVVNYHLDGWNFIQAQ